MLSDVYKYAGVSFRYNYDKYRVEYLGSDGSVWRDILLTPSRWDDEESRRALLGSWLFVIEADSEGYMDFITEKGGAC